jgi:hypothetical protein
VPGTAIVAALVFAPAVAAAATGAAGDTGESGAGSLRLNADVLVDEAVGSGTAGEFAVRGRLFSEEFLSRAEEQRAAAADRVGVVDALTFEPVATPVDPYGEARAALFEEYTATARSAAPESVEDSSVVPLLALVAGVPLVVLAGARVGRMRARRKRRPA